MTDLAASSNKENYTYLRQRFVECLLSHDPASVLDVGCGDGHLLRRCEGLGIEALGLEATDESVGALVQEGLTVVRGVAERIPNPDGSWDWVTLRHVPHHVADPAAALAEAMRVCRSGILVAEPWFDPRFPSQRNALGADRWLKRQHRRTGMVHEDALDLAALLDALPAGIAGNVDVDVVLRLRARLRQDLVEEAEPLLAALDSTDPDRAAYAELMEAIERDGLSWNGSVMVAVLARISHTRGW